MSRWALYVAVAFSAAGCTRLNGAFDDGPGDTDTSTRGTLTSANSTGATGDPSLATTLGPDSTTDASSATDAPPTTQNPTDPQTGSESGTGGELCFTVFDQRAGCDLYSKNSCLEGDCRPYGNEEELTDIGCVGQPPSAKPLGLGDACAHACGGTLGADSCPAGSTCDPFATQPTCVEFCNPAEDFPCDGGSSCAEHFVGSEPFGLCRAGCNPLSNDCAEGQSCYPMPGGPACQPAGSLRPGQPCGSVNDCGPNLTCQFGVDPACGAAACCVELCSVGLNDCPTGQTCVGLRGGIVGGCASDE